MIGIGENYSSQDKLRSDTHRQTERAPRFIKPSKHGSRKIFLLGLASLGILSTILSGCSVGRTHADVVDGKELFIQKCGACHTLKRAGTKGVAGPDLDQAFQRSIRDGFKRNVIKGIVYEQILHPSSKPQLDPVTGKSTPPMPAKLVTGQGAHNIAAYVAQVAAKPGQDTGALGDVGQGKRVTPVAREKAGTLTIPADPSGQLAYVYNRASANSGTVTFKSPNQSPIAHDIAVEGNGITGKGEIVNAGGVSQFTVDLKPGVYTYYCSVPGHRSGGMFGKLTVK